MIRSITLDSVYENNLSILTILARTDVAWTNLARTDVAWTNVSWTNVAWTNDAWSNGTS